MASSSSSAAAISSPPRKYDVFLSFRGDDTRKTFTSHLHAALLRKKLHTYIDDKLERADEIKPALLEAIEKSKLSVIIFSKDYASSTWCLDELVHILGCKERDGQFVIPFFYDISPQDVRKQQGSYVDAFAKLEGRFKDCMDKVLKWRDALEKAANLSGYDYSNKAGTEADSIEKLVEVILNKLDCESSSNLKGLVEIETKVEQIESLLCLDSSDVCIVGIWGMGGIGKTTLADVVYHRLSSKFEACCFLKNVRENSEGKDGIYNLRNELLREILDDKNINIKTPSIGSELIKGRLRQTKVLIVLDDVNDSRQLELLVGDDLEFGVGSRIIITTRDRNLLNEKVVDDKIYEVKGLKHNGALQLFHLHALKNKSPTTVYTEFSRKVIDYIQGIPLALKTLGALFRRCDTEEHWEEELNRLKKFPSEKVLNVLRLSYDGLEENEKECFLDIACFLKGADVYYAKRILEIRRFSVKGIQNLIDKSLISISKKNCLEMHDLLQEMGRTIVREQCKDEPGKRDRLWAADDVYQVLENDTGTSTVQCISFDTSNFTRLELCGSPFKKMSNLRLLIIHDSRLRVEYDIYFVLGAAWFYNRCFGGAYEKNLDLSQGLRSLPNSLRYLYWQRYPFKSLPSNFSPQNLVELRMPGSFVGAELWSKNQNLGNLKVIELSYCVHLTEVPDLSRSKKIEHVVLYGCDRLVRIPSYFKDLDKLRWLNLGECTSLEFLPELPVLCCLEASGCTSLKTVSSSRNSLTQAWDKYELFRGRFIIFGCPNLDENARTNIMADTRLRILRVATRPLKTQQHKEEEIVMEMTSSIPACCRTLGRTDSARTLVSTVCAGNEIPNWFCHENEGSSITIKLPRNWYCTDFLGFALSVVLRPNVFHKDVMLGCSCNFKTNSGESHKTIYPSHYPSKERGVAYSKFGHVFVWYSAFALGEGANLNRSNSFYKLVTGACFEFNAVDAVGLRGLEVKKCGISLLYAEDVETIKSGGNTGWSSQKKKKVRNEKLRI
ncbi:TMV resistance protein N-like [Pyrus ussuriensis x Pyrus communis]|uniref:ADP-ribosyl cyclase/cyclic ADP-ribose hydrolase n=1 Tax=Pyrus ussuriensis x Pyrus communis TaxID=2448454 RepID=A0A5N5IAI8_9ROSA|nr:TMV resistance protein N-like [Pyrus ussuriensis x Pyrus communis]